MEGACEQQLVSALKEGPQRLIPGKVKVFNVVQNLIPKSQLLSIQPGTTVVLVFDTDIQQTVNLRKNLELLSTYCGRVFIVFFPQVLTLEDELIRATDVKTITELTKSSSNRKFKTDFCRMSPKDCRAMLERHHLNYKTLWMTPPPEGFFFVLNNGDAVKL